MGHLSPIWDTMFYLGQALKIAVFPKKRQKKRRFLVFGGELRCFDCFRLEIVLFLCFKGKKLS